MSERNATVLVDWDETVSADVDPLTQAYAELGKAFYDYRFEEPTPELLLYFDRITSLKNSMTTAAKRDDHIEPMTRSAYSAPAAEPRKSSKSFFTRPADFGGTPISPKRAPEPKPAPASRDIPSSESAYTGGPSGYDNKTVVTDEYPFEPYSPASAGTSGSFVPESSGSIASLEDLPDLGGSSSNEPETAPPAAVARFCPECGTPFTNEDIFCGSCGHKLR